MGKIYSVFLVTILSLFTSTVTFAARDRYPSAITAFTGAATYCQSATASNLSVTYSTATCGTTGGTTNTAITVNWYSNVTNSTSGGTLVSTVASTTGTTTFTYTPSTATIGSLYYYVVITWTTGSGGGCTSGGSLSTASYTDSTQLVTVTSPMAYSSSMVSQYSPMNIDLSCTDVTNPILVFQVTVTGGSCSADSITQFNFTTAGSTNALGDITGARLYYTQQTAGYSAFYFFGSVNNPNGAFTINGAQSLLLGAGTYYFYLCYNISSSATSGDVVDATMSSFVINGTSETNMSPNPTCTGTIGNSACSGTPDLASPTANLQTIPAGSYVIPMDNSHQDLWLGRPFNTKAYGLVRALLMQDIPVKWVIKTGKTKDSSDFSAVAAQVYPTAGTAALQYFKASEFIIDTTYLNKSVYPGEKTAIQVMSSFATEWEVAVYKLSSNTTVDVRYTLNHRPKIALFNNGTYQAVQLAMLDSAKVWTSGTDSALSAGAFDGLASCYTFCSEAHWSTGSQAADSATMAPVWTFIEEGGNFLAQCAGINKYENELQPTRHFQSTRGVSDQNVTATTNKYHNPDMAFSQFQGIVTPRSGTVASFELPVDAIAHPSVWRPEMYKCVSFSNSSGATDTMVATCVHLNNPDSVGGNVFYLAGHDYQTNATTGDEIGSLAWINGARMYLNAAFVPANRPTPTPLQAGSNTTICEGGSTTLGGSPTGPASGNGYDYTWSPATGLVSSTSANPVASPTVTTTYTVYLSSSGCSYTPATVVVTVIPTPATPTTSSNSPVCQGSTISLTASTDTGATYSWSGPNGFTSTLQNPTISSASASNAGTYSVVATISGCPGVAGTTVVAVTPTPATPTASSNSPICAGSTLSLTSSTVAGATYSWTGPNGFTSSTQNPSITNATTAATGTYSVSATVSGCASAAGTTTATVNAIPATPTAGSNGPICAGSTLNLTASTIAGATYSWTGPNSFTSSSQNPSITNATVAATGTYSVTASVGGCSSPAGTIVVTVNPIPSAPTASSNSPICAGSNLNLTSSTTAGATYSWSGPNSFTSTTQNPTITAATIAATGTYSVNVTVSGCTSNNGTTVVTVNPIPSSPIASSNSPVCAGSPLNLTASTVAGATYSWTGPNSFTSSSQNPTIAAATVAATGTYSVTATVSGCGSVAATTVVTVNPIPSAPTAGSNSPICAGSALNLTATTIAGATYSWTGPNSFTSSSQNPSIAAATVAATGTYTVNVTVSGCTSANATTVVTVNPIPTAPTVSSNSPVCSGNTLNLTSTAVAGATYSWTGPNSFTSSSQNPSISNVTTLATGTYSLTVTVNGCGSADATTSVTVNPTPAAPTASSNSPVCAGNALSLSSSTVAGATYSWSGPNTFSSSLQNPSIAAASLAASGTYSVTVTVSGCTSAAGTVTATVSPVPSAPTAGSNSPICAGSNLNLSAGTVGGGSYSWLGPNGFSSFAQNPTITAATVAATGTYSVSVAVNGCPSPNAITVVTVNPIPSPPTASSNTPVCSGDPLNLTASTIAGATYSWSGPNSFTSTSQNPTIAAATVAATGTYSVTVSVSGCTSSSAGTTVVTVNPTPAAPTAGSNSPICAGSTLNLTSTTVAGATYSWTGPNSFSSSSQNPSIAAATTAATGTYTLNVTVNGCTSANATTMVTVNPIPTSPVLSSNSPLCTGQTLNLTASTIAGATYTWSGPNSFSSISQNPSLSNVVLADAGTYSVVASVSGCGSASATTTVTINPTPAAPTASSNSPICAGSALNLSSSTVAGATYSWSGPNTFSSSSQNPTIAAATAAAAGTYSVNVTVLGCTSADGTTAVIVNPIPSAPTASSNSPICAGSNLNLTASTTAGASYSWSGPNSFTSTSQNPTITAATVAATGTYSVSITVNGCPSADGTTVVTVNPIPSPPTAGSNTPVCSGDPLNLTASTIAGATYSWTGPNSFTSTSQNPTIAAATVAATGTYSVTVSVSGCTSSSAATTVVTVNPTPAAPTASSNSPICQGSTLNLSANTIAGATYSWTGPNSFTSSTQNPSIAGATVAASGTYTVNVTVNGCTGPNGTTVVTVNPIPTPPVLSSNSPLCTGQTLNLTASTIAGATYTWSGPNTFSSSLQNPSVSNVVLADAGTYSVVASVSGCGSASATTTVTINPTPAAPTASSNSPICSGSALNLSSSTVAGATYSWSGPNTFSSSSQNPTIAAATVAATGTYSVTVTVLGCTSADGTTAVIVNPIPATPTASSNSPVCEGSTLNLSSNTIAGATYNWTGPNSFTSASQNPSISGVTALNAGTYSVSVTVSGCTGSEGTTTVTVIPTPSAPTAGSNSPICSGNPLNLTCSTVAGATYSWTGPNSFTSSTQNPTIAAATVAATGTYSVNVTVSGCTSANANTIVIVNPTPVAPTASSNSPLCSGSTLNLTSSTVGGATYSWSGPNSFSSASQNPSISNATTTNAGTYSVTVTVSGCTGSAGTTTVVIDNPAIVSAGTNQTVCANNDTVSLSGTSSTGSAVWSTSGSGTFLPNNTTLTANYAPSSADITAGTVTITLSSSNNGACSVVTDNLTITITPAPVVNAGPDQTVCANNSNVTLNGSVTIASGGIWTSSGTGSFVPNNTTLNATYVASAADTTAKQVTLVLTSTGNGQCRAVTDTMVIHYSPSPNAEAGANANVCLSSPDYTLSGTSSTGSGTWTTLGSGTFSPNSNVLNPTYIPSTADTSAGSVILILTTTSNGGCNGVSDSIKITYTRTPTVNAGINETVCANEDTIKLNGVSSTGTGTWTTSGSGTFSPNSNTPTASYIPSNADTASGTVHLTFTATGGCSPIAKTITITITPAPYVNAGANVFACKSSPDVTLNGVVSGGAHTGIWTTSGSGTFSPNNTTLNATYVPSTADTSSGKVTLVLTSTGNGNCRAETDTMVIHYTLPPKVFAGPDESGCANNSIPLNGNVVGGGGTGIWSTPNGSGTFSPHNTTLTGSYIPSSADTLVGNVKIVLTSTNNGGCLAETDTLVINVHPNPVVSAGPDQTVCKNNGDVTLSGTVKDATGGAWSSSGSGTFSPNNTTLNATYIPSSADTTAGSVTLVITSTGNGICSPATDTMVVTFSPSPTVNAGSNISACKNNSDIVLSGTSSTGKGIWSTSGSGTFLPNDSDLTATYAPSSSDTATGSVTLTLTSTHNGTCNAVTATVTINYVPAPKVNAGPNQTVCANNDSVSLSGTSSTGSGVWTTNGSGTFSPNSNTLNATYIPSNADTTAGVVRLILTSTSNASCLPVTDTMFIHFTPAPYVNAGSDQTVCANNDVVTLNGSFTVSSGAIWSTTGSGTFSPSNTNMSGTYTPGSSDTSAGSVDIILTSTGNGQCKAVTDTMKVTITPAPKINAGSNAVVCLSSPDYTLSGYSSTGSGSWTTSGSGSFSPNSNTLNATYIPSTADTTAGSVTLILSSTGNGSCTAVTDTITIKYIDSPIVNAGSNQTACANADTVQLNATSNTGSGIWSTGGSGTFLPNSTTLNAQYVPSNADTSSHSVTLTFTSSGGCAPVSQNITINITPAPYVNAGPDQFACESSPDVTLNGVVGGGASTGIWTTSGSGTFSPNNTTLNAMYIPSNADTTSHNVTLILTSTGNGNCLAVSDTMVIHYITTPKAYAGSDATTCSNSSVPLNGLISGGAGTGIWSTPNGGGTFTPSNTALNGSYVPAISDTTVKNVIIVLTSTNNGSCLASSDTMIITVNPGPVVNAGADQSVCKNNDNVSLSGSVKVATGGKWSSSGTGTFSPNDSALNAVYIPSSQDTATGIDTIVLTSTGNGICQQSTDTMIVTYTPAPKVNAGPDIFVCAEAGMSVPLNGSVWGGATKGIWSTLGTGTFTPNDSTLNATYNLSTTDTTAKMIKLVLTSIDNGGCNPVSDTLLITVTKTAIVSAGNDTTVCGNSIIQLNGSVNGGTGKGVWSTNGSGTFTPNDSTLNATYTPSATDATNGSVTFILTSNGGLCAPASDTMIATLSAPPFVNAGSGIFLCEGSTTAALNGKVTGGSTTGVWSTLGSGTFSPNDSDLTATYNLSTADTTAKTVKLVLTSTHNGSCGAVTDTVVIQITAPPVVNAGNDTLVCANDTSIMLNGKITGSSGQGVWSTLGTGTFTPNDSVLTANYKPGTADTAAKFVKLVLTSTNACPVSDTMVIHFSPLPKDNAGANQAICAGSVIKLNGSVGNAGGGQWSSSGTGSFTPNDSALNADYLPSAADVTAGNVILVLTTTGNGVCSAVKDSIDAAIQAKPAAKFVNSASCLGSVIQFTDSSKVTGTTITSWSWNFGNGTSTTQDPTDTFNTTGNRTVTLVVSTSAGCSDTTTRNIYVNPLPLVQFASQVFCPDSAMFTGSATVSPGGIKSWNWVFGDSTNSNLQDPTHTYPQSGNYLVTLIVISDSGCVSSYQDSLKVEPCNNGGSLPPGVPTAFTPNGDGTNDILFVKGGPFNVFDFRVFNEWGNQIFHATSQTEGWDGKFHGQNQPNGTYVWTLTGTTIDGKEVKMTGNVTILR